MKKVKINDNVKYIILSILDFAFTFGGSAGVIIYNYISEDNSVGYKLSLTGIVLLVVLIFTAKELFEKSYRRKYDTLLQQLAETIKEEDKKLISKKLNELKTWNNIYQRLIVLIPFAVLYAITFLTINSLENLRGTVGLILACMSAGSVFNVVKKPFGERAKLNKILKKK